MKEKLKRRRFLVILFLIILIIIVFLFPVKRYTYTEHYIPPVTYKIEINKITKVLKGTFYHSCSAVDCDASTYKYSIKLTQDEYDKIVELWNDKDILSPILETLCEDDKIFYKSYDEYKNELGESLYDYNMMDLNSDGKITSREYANQWLIDEINEK